MIPFYVLLRALLAGVKALFASKATRLERKYTKAALAAEALARQLQTKPGNGHLDPFVTAKSHYEFGRLVEARDRLEEKFLAWQGRAEGVGRASKSLAEWKGRTVPYLCGVIDLGLVLAALHLLGVPHGLTLDGVKGWAKHLVG
jgi:hypothetical protein